MFVFTTPVDRTVIEVSQEPCLELEIIRRDEIRPSEKHQKQYDRNEEYVIRESVKPGHCNIHREHDDRDFDHDKHDKRRAVGFSGHPEVRECHAVEVEQRTCEYDHYQEYKADPDEFRVIFGDDSGECRVYELCRGYARNDHYRSVYQYFPEESLYYGLPVIAAFCFNLTGRREIADRPLDELWKDLVRESDDFVGIPDKHGSNHRSQDRRCNYDRIKVCIHYAQ